MLFRVIAAYQEGPQDGGLLSSARDYEIKKSGPLMRHDKDSAKSEEFHESYIHFRPKRLSCQLGAGTASGAGFVAWGVERRMN